MSRYIQNRAMTSSLKTAKKELRSLMKNKLLSILPESIDAQSRDYESLERDSWGIPTINAGTVGQREHVPNDPKKETEALDLILMPGVAFDLDPSTGYVRRLGHGKGFYDYFLHRYIKSRGSHVREITTPGTDVLLCGLALQEQFLVSETGSSVPVEDHDNLLHSLLVGDGKLWEGPLRK
ncbi:hypothetical protein JHW43_001735 [Diplocarpon mali]|nr:hypothetical protein JHW43_001735 [Diplocarpon mali]